jgi:uncharacterized protein YlaI
MEKCMFYSRILSDGPGIAWCICERCAVRVAIKRIERAERGEENKKKSSVDGIDRARSIPFIPTKDGFPKSRPW